MTIGGSCPHRVCLLLALTARRTQRRRPRLPPEARHSAAAVAWKQVAQGGLGVRALLPVPFPLAGRGRHLLFRAPLADLEKADREKPLLPLLPRSQYR